MIRWLLRLCKRPSPSQDFWDTEPDFDGPARPTVSDDGKQRIWVPDRPSASASPSDSDDDDDYNNGICSYLDISTGHLPQRIFEDLSNWSSMRVVQHEYGTIIFVPEDNDPQWSPELLRIIVYARSLYCGIINLDQDARRITTLEYYNW